MKNPIYKGVSIKTTSYPLQAPLNPKKKFKIIFIFKSFNFNQLTENPLKK